MDHFPRVRGEHLKKKYMWVPTTKFEKMVSCWWPPTGRIFKRSGHWISRSLRQLSHASESSQSFAGSDSTGPNFTSTLRKFNAWEQWHAGVSIGRGSLLNLYNWYCWWFRNPEKTSWYGRYPIIYTALYITGGAGFLLSRVCVDIESYDSYDARKQHMQPVKCCLFGSCETPLQNNAFFPNQNTLSSTYRIIPNSKCSVTPMYKPFRPFGRGTTPLRELANMFVNHLGWSSKQELGVGVNTCPFIERFHLEQPWI